MEVNGDGGAQEVHAPYIESSRGGQEAIHVDGLREGLHHSGSTPRLVPKELGGGQRPDRGSLQESVGPGDGVGHDKLGAGVHPLQYSKNSEREQGMHTRQAPRLTSEFEPGEYDTREAGRREGVLRTGEGRCCDTASVARASPTPSVPVGEPLKLGNVGAAGGCRDSVILLRNPQWVIREIDRCTYGHREKKPTTTLTNRPAWIPNGQDKEWALQGREVHGMANEQWPVSGKTKHPG